MFTENNPSRSIATAASMAAASRVMKGYNDTLSTQCLQIAKEIWNGSKGENAVGRVPLAVELLITTRDTMYANYLVSQTKNIASSIDYNGWLVARTMSLISDKNYHDRITNAVKKLYAHIKIQGTKTPYGLPYEPSIWARAWGYKNLVTSNISFTPTSLIFLQTSIC
ncbi:MULTISPECIES: hypothetical protein [unclassified Mucilaginibacter]|uniref:hypothetical protein n=1 Tax=unclassified Mucilaginibacter TaxID=2617802 RepID=UPI003397CA2E